MFLIYTAAVVVASGAAAVGIDAARRTGRELARVTTVRDEP